MRLASLFQRLGLLLQSPLSMASKAMLNSGPTLPVTLRVCSKLLGAPGDLRPTARYPEALTAVERAVGLAETLGDDQLLAQVRRVIVLGFMEKQHDAARVAEGIIERAEAEHEFLEGNPQAALAWLEPLIGRPDLQDRDTICLIPTLAWAQLLGGDAADAERVVVRAVKTMAERRNDLGLVGALRARAMAGARPGRWPEAAHDFEQAVSLARGMA